MGLVQIAVYSVAGFVAAILQLLFEAVFGPAKARQRKHSKSSAASAHSRRHETGEQSLSDEALVRLCRRLQEELRRKDKELTSSKASLARAHPLGLHKPFYVTCVEALTNQAQALIFL